MWIKLAIRCVLVGAIMFGIAWLIMQPSESSTFDADRLVGEDIYYIWLEGARILDGENPYARVLEGNMRENNKYATYFPLFYLLASGTQLLGLHDFATWVSAWRIVFLLCDAGIAFVIFWAVQRRAPKLLAIFAALFWMLNRWSVYVALVAHIDFLAILCLLASLMLLRRRLYAACVLFGVSLAIKQIAIFAAPLYLIWAWQALPADRVKRVLLAGMAVGAVPLLVSLPFVVWSPEGFIKSILFSATRDASGGLYAQSLDVALQLEGLIARLPMLGLLSLIYVMAWRRMIPPFSSILLVMAVFVSFNSVLFDQYFAWLIPFLPLALLDVLPEPVRQSTSKARLSALADASRFTDLDRPLTTSDV